jgi:hypothetical protein
MRSFTNYFPQKILLESSCKGRLEGWACNMHGDEERPLHIFGMKADGKGQWEDLDVDGTKI